MDETKSYQYSLPFNSNTPEQERVSRSPEVVASSSSQVIQLSSFLNKKNDLRKKEISEEIVNYANRIPW